MYDANRVHRRLRLYVVRHCHDICFLTLLKCIAVYDFLIISKKLATIIPLLSGLQMRIPTDEVRHSNIRIYTDVIIS